MLLFSMLRERQSCPGARVISLMLGIETENKFQNKKFQKAVEIAKS